MLKTIGLFIALTALAACEAPQRHVTTDGRTCHPTGPVWAPTWVTPDNMRAC
jgi:hypothetical protein